MDQFEPQNREYSIHPGLYHFIKWFALAMGILVIGCGVTEVILISVPSFNDFSNSMISNVAVSGSIAGIIVAFLIGRSWNPPIHAINVPWLLANILGMIIGIFVMSRTAQVVNRQSYPITALAVIIFMVGALFGGLQWLFLRRNTRLAGWWIPAMATSWTIIWLLVYFVAWFLSD